MSAATTTALQRAVMDTALIARYRSHITIGNETDCHLWTGAISAKGHGRFQVGATYTTDVHGAPRRQTHVVIAHRFGYAIHHGLDELLTTPIVAHACDNPLCQNPAHWCPSTHSLNAREWANRRATIGTAHADLRGARGRAHAVREAARQGVSVREAVLAGMPRTHVDQLPLFDER